MLPFLSIIIVNYNGQRWLRDCLSSVVAQSYSRHRVETIIVDNGSTDSSISILRRYYPWVRVIEARRNLGFAAGNNLGFAQARGDWIALLNTDAVAEPEWLSRSIQTGESDPGIGGVAAHLALADRPGRVNSTGLKLLRDGRGADRDSEQADPHRPAGEVFGGCGAGLVLRRAMLDRIGLFDQRLFMYYEDLDLAWRARRAGWKFVYDPQARVRHAVGGSGGASPLQTRCIERNRVLVNLRHAPIAVAMGNGLGAIARVVRAAVRRRHVAAHGLAMLDIARHLPAIVLERMKQGGADRLYREWSRDAA